MTTQQFYLYHSKSEQPDSNALKQELVTYQQTSVGIKITKLERSFSNSDHLDNYTSAPLVLGLLPEQEGLLWGAVPKKES